MKKKSKTKSMTTEVLENLVKQEIKQGIGGETGDLANERAEAWKYYLGEPFGNEVPNRSQFVSTDVMDTIESALPALLKVFLASGQAMMFDPVGPEDEAAAKQETDYVNHVFLKKNPGVLILYTWIKDALMQKVGYTKAWYQKDTQRTPENYDGITDEELTLLMNDDGYEVTQYDNETITIDGQPVNLHSVRGIRVKNNGCVKVANLPPEEIIVSRRATSVDLTEVPMVAHVCRKTVSDVREMGIDLDDDDVTESGAEIDTVLEKTARNHLSDELVTGYASEDKSQTLVLVSEVYIRVDYDGDGIAELRRIVTVNHKIKVNEPWDVVPIVGMSPVLLPHKAIGLSLYDVIGDLQLLKSTFLRQIIDNLFLINNTRHTVVDGMVNMGDLLDSRPGGIVRQEAPGMVEPLATVPLGASAFGMLEYTDTQREARSGITRYNQGMDADSLNKTATGVNRIMDASAARMELMAMLMAESVKRLFLIIHSLLLKHHNVKDRIKLRGEYVQVNPAEWRDRTDMTINVGLGTGNKDQVLARLMNIMGIQKEIVANGGMGTMVTPANLFNTASKIAEAAGFAPELFFTNPDNVEPPPQNPDIQEQALQLQAQIEQGKRQIDAQKLEIERLKVQADIEHVKRQEEIDMGKARLHAETQVITERMRQDGDTHRNEIASTTSKGGSGE